MKKIIQIACILLISFSIQAQNDQKAKGLLDDVSAKIKSYNNIIIDFKYALNNPKENINQESKGNVAIEGVTSGKYNLNFMGVTKIFDGKKVYTIVPEDEEISISKFDENDKDAITPNKMLTFFNSGFKYVWDQLLDIKGRKIQYIKLIPISSKDQRKEILIGIDPQTKHIYNIIEIGKNGTRTTLTVNSFKTSQPLSKNHFTFTESKYPNYYINRLD
ncbi:outer membrane lipoprotein carrier protein LolA [Flavobacterium chuncheonense]|uniref:Outer membrane lipoprotein carrier protein LolA n=1 Tax=Flavobacterium chuncheonense TaxID=2026653 RepID=A0ABW5YNZ1_9FLAO